MGAPGSNAVWMFTIFDSLTTQIVYSVDLKTNSDVAGFISSTKANLENYILLGSNYTQRALLFQPVHREEQARSCPGYGNVTFPFIICSGGLLVSEISAKLAIITKEELFGSYASDVCTFGLIGVLVFAAPPPVKPVSFDQCKAFCYYGYRADKKSCSVADLSVALSATLKTVCVVAARLKKSSCLYKAYKNRKASRCEPPEVSNRVL